MATFRPLLRILLEKAKLSRTGYGSNPSATGGQGGRNGSIPLSAPYARAAESQKDLVKDAWSASTIENEIDGPPSRHQDDFGRRDDWGGPETRRATNEGVGKKGGFITMPRGVWKSRGKEDAIV